MENLFKTILLLGEGDLAKGMARYERHPEDLPVTVMVSTDQEPFSPRKKRRKLLDDRVLQCIRDVFSTHECSLEIINKILDEMHSTKTLPSHYYYHLKLEDPEEEDD
jgi:hypothetical protein